MKKLFIILMLIPCLVFAKSKKAEYKNYLAKCEQIIIDTVQQSGYVRFDTILVKVYPYENIFMLDNAKRYITRRVPIKGKGYLIMLKDTIWSDLPALEYRSSSYYYQYPGHEVPKKPYVYKDLSKEIIVFRKAIIKSKRERPLSYKEWLNTIYD